MNNYCYIEKFGKIVMKISNEYLIKYQSHWNMKMAVDKMRSMGKTLPTGLEITKYINKFL